MEEFSADLINNLYGNPHSASTPSAIAGHRVETIRERTLRFFNADPEHFDLIFVANATAAIKLVIDCFKDHAATSNTPVWYGYHRDAHTSLVGIRESTKLHRCFTSDEEVDIWINSGGLGGPRARQFGLFAYPGQSNMTGRRLPTSWPGRIRKSFHKAPTYTLFDAAALATTAPLDLSDPATAPDFVALSFYKIFGFPNIGALIVRRESAHVLESRKYFGGGTVEMVISINDTWHAKKETSLHDRLEDGTLPFHSIFALDHAMNVHERLYGPNPMKFISHHTAQLGKQLFDGISGLRHANGIPVCRIYKDESAVYGDPSVQGATIAFNVQKSDGSLVGFEEVEEAADNRNIYVRSGSLCNPGGVATYLGWSPAEMKAAYASGHRCSNPTQIMLGKATGVVRVSLGAMNTAGDVSTLIRFLEETYVETSATPAPRINRTASLPHLNAMGPGTGAWSTSQCGISEVESESWEASPVLGMPPSPMSINEKPTFNPTDYTKRRKPWEEELRKQNASNPGFHGVSSREVKSRGEHPSPEDGSSVMKSGTTPSFRARKFGRSVVNLLKSKSAVNYNFADQSPVGPPSTTRYEDNHFTHHHHYQQQCHPPMPPPAAPTARLAH